MALTMAGATALSGGLSAGSGLVGSLIGLHQAKKDREFNAREAQKNRDFQRDERLAAQEWELDMWNLANDYNDIGSQVDRARLAGVNPASIVGGDYKPAQADTLSTTPQSGSMASTSAGGAVGSAIASSWPNIGNSFAQGVKGLVDAKATDEMLAYNKKHLNSVVQHNLASVQKMAHDNGLTDATAEQILKSISWMDGLNDAEIKLKSAQATKLYNENFEIYQSILESRNRMKNDDARVDIERDVADANVANINAQTDYQETINNYADGMQKALLSQEEVRAVEAEKRKEFAETYNIPLGSSDFEFAWALQLKGKYEEYCTKCIAPAEQASWKPNDYKQTYKDGLKVFGIPLFDKDNTEYAFPRSFKNPTYNQFNKEISPYPIPAYMPYY